MLKDFEYEGYWTRAGSTVRVPGTLKYSPETGCQLRLNGAFDPAPTFIGFVDGPEVREKVIHGVTNDGKPVTLLDSLHEDGEMYFNVRCVPYRHVSDRHSVHRRAIRPRR